MENIKLLQEITLQKQKDHHLLGDKLIGSFHGSLSEVDNADIGDAEYWNTNSDTYERQRYTWKVFFQFKKLRMNAKFEYIDAEFKTLAQAEKYWSEVLTNNHNLITKLIMA